MKRGDILFFFGILPGLVFQFAGALFYFVLLKDKAISQWLYGGTKILLLVWPIIWFLYVRSAFVGIKPHRGQSAVTGLLGGMLMGAVVILSFLLFHPFLGDFESRISGKFTQFGLLTFYIPFAVFLSAGHSLLEEYYWRWFVLRGLMARVSANWAIAISSLAFASHHFLIVSQFFPLQAAVFFTAAIGGAGAIWAVMYIRTGSILGSWISHAFADAAIMAIGYYLIV